MNISKFESYFGKNHSIYTSSPEWKFITLISGGYTDEAVSLFGNERDYGNGPLKIDTPYGEFNGPEEIKQMAEGWRSFLQAESIIPSAVSQTRGGGRSVTEIVLHYTTSDGEEHAVPMAAVADLKHDDMMDELRLYWNWHLIPGTPAYRPPVFPPREDLTCRHEMLSGAVRDYMVILHDPNGNIIERADKIFADRLCFGGYEHQDYEYVNLHDFIEPFQKGIGHTLSQRVHLRMETIIDDGRICCVEWEQLVTKLGREQYNRLSQAGISFYELNEEGKIWSVRIIDYANTEKDIDWSTARRTKEEAEAINYIGK